jgi:hypothetical protein
MQIEKIAKKKLVEKCINRISPSTPHKDDLIQEIYLILCLKWEAIEAIPDNEISYYISRIVCNQVKSNTSPYYYKYIKWDLNKTTLEVEGIEDEED